MNCGPPRRDEMDEEMLLIVLAVHFPKNMSSFNRQAANSLPKKAFVWPRLPSEITPDITLGRAHTRARIQHVVTPCQRHMKPSVLTCPVQIVFSGAVPLSSIMSMWSLWGLQHLPLNNPVTTSDPCLEHLAFFYGVYDLPSVFPTQYGVDTGGQICFIFTSHCVLLLNW